MKTPAQTTKQLTAINEFVRAAEQKIYKEHIHNGDIGPVDTLVVDWGRKFAKIVKINGLNTGRSVYCFIEINSGDIYKAASWAAPAKHVRGNINTEDHGMSAVTSYGANYIR